MQLVIGGLSGSGKDTAVRLLEEAGVVRRGVTITTRPPRPGEVDGVSYDFMTPEEFDQARGQGELAEETRYIGNPVAYGISWRRINEARQSQIPTCWILDTVGLERMRELFPGAVVGVFLVAPREVLADRMRRRGEDEATIERRLKRYDDEVALGCKHFEHVIDTAGLGPSEVASRIRSLLDVAPHLVATR